MKGGDTVAYNKIAIVGRIRSGKNTFADYVTENYRHKQFAFGDGIKEVIKRYFPEALVAGRKPRKFYQVIGQSFRLLNPYIWINILMKKISVYEMYHGKDTPIIITDLRQINEYETLKSMGYTVIKVVADEDIRLKRIEESGDVFTYEELNHETELQAAACPCDYLVENNGTLEELHDKAKKIMEELKND